ncbi:hypothetical protein [Desulfobacula sp.]|uniref:hypothetical protein n=1 Tax=Desulfobacula sp. TaxID=2593537 RepID=UPI00260F3137|nr:hypothetical protein [Desulfobacula sp.]
MRTQTLTDLINTRLDRLKDEVNSAPAGGGLESLCEFLDRLQDSIGSFERLLDGIQMLEYTQTPGEFFNGGKA